MGYDAENCHLRIPTLENHRQGEAVAAAQNGAQDLERLPSPIPSGEDAGADRTSSAIWMFALALLAFAVRAPGILYGFVYDDAFNIAQRSPVNWSRIPSFFTTNQSATTGSNFYRPVLYVWCEVFYGLFGTHAAAWHLASILFHVACVVLVFRLALAVIEDRFVAWTAAALFAVHPAHVEAIAWASAVGDLMMTFFLLCSVLAFLRWTEQGKLGWWIASFAAGAAGVFTKETAVVLPVVLLATVLALRSRAKPGLPVILATVPFFALTIFFLGVRQSVLHAFAHLLTPATNAQMIFTWPSALLFYLRCMFWPSVVVPYYPLSIVKQWNSAEFFGPLLALIAVAGILGYLLWRAAGGRRFCLCLVWMLIPLAPVLYLKALFPLELVHDRFLYIPLVGFCMAAAMVLQWASKAIEAKTQWRLFPIVAVTLILLLSIASLSQMVWWRSNTTLFTRALTVTPDNVHALDNLGYAHISESRYQQAVPLLQRSLEIDPRDSKALFGLARIAWLAGDYSAAETYLTQAVSYEPTYDMWLHLASVEMHKNRIDLAEAAVRRSLAMNPTGAGAHVALGIVLLAKGDRAAAASEFQEELRTYPDSQAAQVGLARATANAPQ